MEVSIISEFFPSLIFEEMV